jgi:DNA-binding transcriptional LysR family regulator
MDLRQLEIFKLIAESGSFSTAAQRLNLTQSALSHQMRALEEELGEQLLVRARPRVYATAAGQRVLASAERIFAEISEVKAQFERTRKGESIGSVRVASTHLAMTYVYGELLEQFSARHPEVELVFHATETTEDPVQRVLQRHSDVGFTVLPVKHPQLLSIPLFRAEQVVIVGRKHPLAKQKQTTVEELRHWPFARFEARTGGRQISDSLFLKDGGYPPILAESNAVEYLKRIIRIGFGAAVVPAFCVRTELASGTLHALRLRSGPVLQEAGLVVRRDVTIRALDLFRSVCLELRGAKLRTINLDNVERPVFEPV